MVLQKQIEVESMMSVSLTNKNFIQKSLFLLANIRVYELVLP